MRRSCLLSGKCREGDVTDIDRTVRYSRFVSNGRDNEAALAGGLILLANAYLFALLMRQGDKYGIWHDARQATTQELRFSGHGKLPLD